MYNHEPSDYICPFCNVVSGGDNQPTKQSDIFFKDDIITAFVSPKWWPNNPGHVLIIPNIHVENIYNIDESTLHTIYSFVKKVSIAIKETYKCDGVSTRQHNEPAGGQDVWHFHVHVFPRYVNDKLYQNHDQTRWTKPEERTIYVERLKHYFGNKKK